MEKICGIYKITNTITGDFYIGSSKNVKQRWKVHKIPSTWKKCPNNQMYLDFQKYGIDKFVFEILEEAEEEKLKETEQQFIEILKPTYNNYNANGWNIERYKEWQKSEKGKESHRKASNKYNKSDKGKEYKKTSKCKESNRKSSKKYDNQLCFYNGETLTLCALRTRFRRASIPHPTLEAKKYLI